MSRYDNSNMFFPDDKVNLKMGTDCQRKTVIMPVVELSFIKSIKDAAGVTVNDVMLSATAGMSLLCHIL